MNNGIILGNENLVQIQNTANNVAPAHIMLAQHNAYIEALQKASQIIRKANHDYQTHVGQLTSLEALSIARQKALANSGEHATAAASAQRILNEAAKVIASQTTVTPSNNADAPNAINAANDLIGAYAEAAKLQAEAANQYQRYAAALLTTPALFDEHSQLNQIVSTNPDANDTAYAVKKTLMQVYPTFVEADQEKIAQRALNHYNFTLDEAQEEINTAKENYTDFVYSLGTKQEVYYAADLAKNLSLSNDEEITAASLDILKTIPSYTLSDIEELSSSQKVAILSAHSKLKAAYETANRKKENAALDYQKRTKNAITRAALTAQQLEAEEARRKDNRLWYDVTQWTWPEIIGRFVAVPYAILCGLSIEASLVGVGAGALFAGLSAFVSSSVNLKGFWTNVSTMLTDFFSGTKNSPKGIYRGIYYLYAFGFGLSLALLNTAMTLENVRDTFNVQGDGFWQTIWIPIVFGGTFLAVWGLFVQEQFKWLSDTKENGVVLTPWMRLKRTMRRLLGIEADPNLLLAHEQNDASVIPSKKARAGRLILTLILTGLLAYGAYVVAPIVSETFTTGFSSLARNSDFGYFDKQLMGAREEGISPYGNLLAPASSTFSVLFVIASIIYGLGLAKRLSDAATRYARGTHDWAPSSIWAACVNKEKACWQAAVEYGHKEKLKGNWIPVGVNILLNYIYQNLSLLVFWNAGNNAGLFVNTKLESMLEHKEIRNDERVEEGRPEKSENLTDKNKVKIAGTALSTGARSAGFGLIATLEGVGTASPVIMSADKNPHWNTHIMRNPTATRTPQL